MRKRNAGESVRDPRVATTVDLKENLLLKKVRKVVKLKVAAKSCLPILPTTRASLTVALAAPGVACRGRA